jgi:FAD:protein FMN transferase
MAPEAPPASGAGLVEHRFRSMGCDVAVLVPDSAPDAADAARQVIDEWDATFSRFRPSSELERLNEAGGRQVAASERMLAVIRTAIEAARATDGLFDPLLGGRLVELGYDRTFDELPPQRSGTAPRAWRGGAWREIDLKPQLGTVRLPVGYRLDLGGLAKGMAVDDALATIVAAGIGHAAVSAGGDLAVVGLPPGKARWPVAIDGQETVIALREGGLATSSVLRRRWSVDGTLRHHLLDPRTGLPSNGPIVQASVAAPTCGQAEVAAKVAILSSLEGAIGWLETHRLAAVLVASDGATWRVGSWE